MSTYDNEDFHRVNAAAHMAVAAAIDYVYGRQGGQVFERAARDHIRGIESTLANNIRDLLGALEISRLKPLEASAQAAHGVG